MIWCKSSYEQSSSVCVPFITSQVNCNIINSKWAIHLNAAFVILEPMEEVIKIFSTSEHSKKPNAMISKRLGNGYEPMAAIGKNRLHSMHFYRIPFEIRRQQLSTSVNNLIQLLLFD